MNRLNMNTMLCLTTRWAFLLLIISAFSIPVFAIRQWTPDDDIINGIPVDGAVTLNASSLGIGHLTIHFTNPQVKMEQVELNKRVYTTVSIEGETRLWELGKPSLPLVSRAIRLPNTGNVKLVVSGGEYDEYSNIDVLPQQSTDTKDSATFAFDETQYKTNAWYPSELARLSGPDILRDARVAALAIQPVQYNPVTKTLRVYRSINIETIPIGGMGTNEILSNRSHAVPSFAGVYSEIIGADDLVEDARNAPPGQVLIICRPNVAATMQTLANWKTQSGRPTQIMTTSTLTSTVIKNNIIIPAYNSFNPPLENILLVGDGGNDTSNDYNLPAPIPSITYTYSDHWYGQMTTSILASIWVSRLSCNNVSELMTHINRSINYEKNPPTADTTWFTYGWGYAGISHNIVTNPSNIRFCLDMMHVRGITNTIFDTHNGNVDANLIGSRLTDGAIFWAHRAAWIGEISATTDFGNINNVNKPFIALNITCSSGDWYGTTTTGVAEGLTKLGSPSQPKGALSGMSTSTAGTNPAHNNVMSAGTFYALGVKGARQAGPMYYEGKFQMWRNYIFGDSVDACSFIYWNNPMGDICVNFWTGVPHTINANLPTNMGIGQNQLAFQVLQGTTPVPGAMVTAWKKNAGGLNETYVRGVTDDNGHINLTMTNTTAGTLVVTVNGNQVGQNILPLIDSIQVSQTTGDLAFRTLAVQDDSTNGRIGNNNATANPGETIDLNVTLTNRAGTTATGISGIMTSPDSRITVINNSANWNQITSTGTGVCTTPFRVHLLGGFIDNEVVNLQVVLTSDQGTRTINVPVPIRTMRLTYSSNNTSSVWNTGSAAQLAITVVNNGGLSVLTPTTATLVSLTNGVTVQTPSVQFATLPTSIASTNTTRWDVYSSITVVPGTQASFKAYFVNGVMSDSVSFTVPVGTRTVADPTGPDTYGYYAYDNNDSLYTVAPNYNWIELVPGLGGTGTRLPLDDDQIARNSASDDTSMVIHLPFTVRYYGLLYDSATICSNGWLAFGSQPLYNNSRNWHLPAFEGPRNIVAVNWCDQKNDGVNQGVYTYTDVTNHQFVVTWRDSTLYSSTLEEYQLIIYDQNFYPSPSTDAPLKFQYKVFRPAVFNGTETGVNYCTIGIADNTYTRALEYCYWNQYTPGSAVIPTSTSANRAILFTTTAGADTSLMLVAPNGGDSLAVALPYTIRWRGRPALANVNIDVNRTYPSTNWTRLFTNTPNDGNESWTAVTPVSTTARIRVLSTTGNEGDTSGFNFIIAMPRLGITSPNGGESLSSLQDTVITWNSSLMTGTVTLEINRNYPSGSWDTLFAGLDNNGTHIWRPASPAASHVRIRILSDLNSAICDTTDADLEILGSAYLAVTPNPINVSLAPSDSSRRTITVTNNGDADYEGFLNSTTTSEGYRGDETNAQGTGPVYQWFDPSAGFNGPSGNNQVGGPYIMPFSFYFFGVYYDSMWVSTNGFISFTQPINSEPINYALPTPIVGPILALYWAHLNPAAGQIKVRTDFSNHRVIVAYLGVPLSGSSSNTINCEAVFDNTGKIYFEYGAMPATYSNVCVGIQDAIYNDCVMMHFQQNIPSTDAMIFSQNHAFAYPSVNYLFVSAGQSTTFTMLFDSHNRSLGDTLAGYIYLNGDASNTPLYVPVNMYVRTTGVLNREALPTKFDLHQNTPNPFNPVTDIRFDLAKSGTVNLAVYSIDGRLVTQLVNENRPAGSYRVQFDGSRLATGVYFYRLQAGSYVAVRKMVLVK